MSYVSYSGNSNVEKNISYTNPLTGQELTFKYAYFGLFLNASAIQMMNFTAVNVTMFDITYINCPAVVHGLAFYNNSPAARTVSDYFITNGSCLSNSEPSLLNKTLQRYCDVYGNSTFDGECWCSAGYEMKNGTCMECPTEYFKSSKGLFSCMKCGKLTDVINLRTSCKCKVGTYRLANETNIIEKDCYYYPSTPSLSILMSNTSAVLILAKSSTKGESLNNFIEISCLQPKYLYECNATPFLLEFNVIENLLPYTSYEFQICVHNAVSLSNQYRQANCINVNFTTLNGLPTSVYNLTNSYENGVTSLSWAVPLSTGTSNIVYRVRCDGVTEKKVNKTTVSIDVPLIQASLNCCITPESNIGIGPVSCITLSFFSENSSSSTNLSTIFGSLTGVLIIVGALGFCLQREKKRKLEIVAEQKIINELELQTLHEEHIKQLREENQKNTYVPIDAAIIQSWSAFGEQEPVYEEIASSYNYSYSDLIIKEKIGEGHFALVHKAEAFNICGHKGKSTVAVKELKSNCSEMDKKDFENELEIMLEIKSHPHVVRLLGVCNVPHCIIIEFVPGGDLQTCLVKSRMYRNTSMATEGSYLTSYYLLLFAYQIASGMQHLSEKRIIHRDLACRNILVGYGRVCKIADLGLARRLDENGLYKREKQALLPVKWLSPESIKTGWSSVKSDVWSYGILLWEIVTIGGVPYPGFRSKDIPRLLLEEKYRMPKPEHCRDEVYQIMLSCWHENEHCRPTFSDLANKFNVLKDDKIYVNLDQYDDDAYLPLDEEEGCTIKDQA